MAKAEKVKPEKQSKTVVSSKVATEAHKAQLEKEALEKVYAKLGVTKEQVEQVAKANLRLKNEKVIPYIIPFECKINGKKYPRQGKAPEGVVEMLRSMAFKKQNRLLREKVRSIKEVEMLSGGLIGSKVIRREDLAGSPISNF